jgi:glycosyltransferase involved in cell wall biosynthesis
MHVEGAGSSAATPAITLLVCTYNRSTDLRELLDTAVRQETGGEFEYEVLVVDNNSTDQTREVVHQFADNPRVRYRFEARQGKSYALNTGLAAARSDLYVIVDDDFVLPADWVRKIVHTFRERPELSFVSGKVLPAWMGPVPSWLGPEHWSAVALADYGDEAFEASTDRQVCLLACAFRRADVLQVGGYEGRLGVSAARIGGVEDLEILQRLWAAGRKGLYVPSITFQHKVQPSRLTKAYHRRWHTDHGRSYAHLRDAGFERSSARVWDVPLHVFRGLAVSLARCGALALRGRGREAFLEETKARFFLGFITERRQQHFAAGGRGLPSQLLAAWRARRAGHAGGARRPSASV